MSRLYPTDIEAVYPIRQVEIFPNGVYRIIRKCKGEIQSLSPPRGQIMKCSKTSLVRMMAILQSTDVEFNSMLTLTYPAPFPNDGLIVKADLAAFLQKMRRDKMGHYVWFLEFQKRGAPHIHFLLETDAIIPSTRTSIALYWADRISQAEWFLISAPIAEQNKIALKVVKVHLHSTAWFVLDSSEGAKRYGMKYAAKEKQKKVPKQFTNVGRFWGMSDGVKPETHIIDTEESEIRAHMLDKGYKAATWDYLPKYVW